MYVSETRTNLDSMLRELKVLKAEPIPRSEVNLQIPMDSLRSLPPRAGYHAKSGRASVDVHAKGDTVIVHATCDSLQRLCEYYERELSAYAEAYGRQTALAQEKETRRSYNIYNVLAAFIAGVTAGMAIAVLICKK